ncbi:MAG: type II CRISPR RNA-guided endonuclease Cas9, partial [Rikenellaceae bacterium]
KGYSVEVEHIIPRSLFFDDSLSNKVCSCSACNKEKNNRTAYDYMKTKSEGEFTEYLERIDRLFKEHKISRTKRDRLLTAGDNIPTDFIDRQLRESQYIARKSREILSVVCRSVTATSGSVTDKLRSLWGWDRVLHNLNFERYKTAGLTEIKHREHKGKSWDEEVIRDWSKRLDHRHHAIDALVIACTKQGYIQRINNMSELKDVNFKGDEHQGEEYQGRLSRLERYLIAQPHPSTAEVESAASAILVSFKAGKKVATLGKRYIHKGGERCLAQSGIVVPRGALHEESVYGVITTPVKSKSGEINNNKQVVIKYSITSIVRKDLDYIVDKRIRAIIEERFNSHQGAEKDVWKDLNANPILFNNAPIKSVRCRVGALTPAFAKTSRGYVKMGNNHHVAIYTDSDGKRIEQCVTFWSAIERRKNNIPIIIENPDDVWSNLTDGLSEEFLSTLPDPTWQFEVSLQQNEMFILGIEPEAVEEAMRMNDYALLNRYLYRVQKLATKNYYMRLHIETTVDDKYINSDGEKKKNEMISKGMGKLKIIQSMDSFFKLHPQKVYVNLLGEIKRL